MDSTIAAVLLLDGIGNGAVYALLGMAIVLVFAVTRVILIPQGEFVAYSALTLAMLQLGRIPGTVWLALLLAGLAVLLDEPSPGLAPLVVKEIFRIIERLRATGVTSLLIEQNARAAMAVADHAYVLETGAIAQAGPAAELAQDPRVIDTYLGKAAK